MKQICKDKTFLMFKSDKIYFRCADLQLLFIYWCACKHHPVTYTGIKICLMALVFSVITSVFKRQYWRQYQ